MLSSDAIDGSNSQSSLPPFCCCFLQAVIPHISPQNTLMGLGLMHHIVTDCCGSLLVNERGLPLLWLAPQNQEG